MANISMEHICKTYPNGVGAVEDFNLEVQDREFIIFVGPSGCGKSTTLRMIAGLEDITSGTLKIDGETVNEVPAKNRDIAMVFQSYALYPHMSVYDNIAFGLRRRKLSREETDQKVREAARILDLESQLKKKPRELSGGQKQRVAMGAAIVRNPKVFLMDEPLSNLDAKLRVQMRLEIAQLYERLQATMIYVTHDQTEAMTLGTRIVVMKDGVIQQIGTPQEVFDHPANLFVAGFIGMPRMNMFSADLVKENGKYSVKIGEVSVELDAEKQAKLEAKKIAPQSITLGVRPEHVSLAKSGEAALHGTIDVSEMMGSAVHLHVNTMGVDAIIIVQTMGLDAETMANFATGKELAFTFNGSVAHVFSKETGENLEF